jgi:hypothetical protein
MALSRWHNAGHLVKVERGKYSVDDLDEFLRVHARDFNDGPPTWKDLRSQALVLLKYDEIESLYGLTGKRLYSLQRSTPLAHIKLPGAKGGLRFRREDILKLLEAPVPFVSGEFAARTLGREIQAVKRLIARGELEKARDPERSTTARQITRDSLATFLRKRLPPWIDPEDWIKDRESSTEPLVPLPEVARVLGVGKTEAMNIMKQQRAQYIVAGNNVMVSADWLTSQAKR